MMARIPTSVSALLQEITDRLSVILGPNLVGFYLYGSLTQGAFNPKRSDVDCIVVTERDVGDAQFKGLGAWLEGPAPSDPWMARLQMTFLIKGEVLTMDSSACLYQFGRLERIKSDANPIIWMNVLESGIVLYGEPPESFVPRIGREVMSRALEREVGYLRDEISTKPDSEWRDVPSYRAYAVLTLCRILYTFKKGAVVSEPRAARWAVKNLPDEFRAIILQALAAGDSPASAEIPLSQIERFVDLVDTQLHSLPGPGPSRSSDGTFLDV
jgi:predicted nucleotidyltransferase